MSQTQSADELLDWLCWVWATEGERFYPPEETAEECMESVAENYEDRPEEDRIEALGWERGQHTRAWTTAVDRFEDLRQRGFDPKERAQREIERSREQGLDLPDIDWEWLEETRYGSEKENNTEQ